MNLDDLLNEMSEKMRNRDLSDEYLREHNNSTREEIGIGEYAYGITMIPCEWVYKYLSDYKRVLKENEILKEEKEQAWEEWNNLEQGSYGTEQKLKQQIKELKKENEELKFEERRRIIGKYGDAEIHDVINKILSNDYIPVQKVKDKIEKYKNMCISSVSGYENYFKDNYNELVFRRIEQLEKELLGEFIDEPNEKYQFTWNEENQELKLSQTPPPEPQLPTKTICESFSKKVRNK